MVPRLLTFTAGDDGPVALRVWVIPERDLVELVKRAGAGEKPDDLMLELVLADAAVGSEEAA